MPSDRGLRFGTAAELYERARPSYPAALVDDVVAALPGRRVVEVGAGTGKATALLLGHDLDLVCLEPDPAMAALLRTRTGDVAPVVGVTFEDWDGPAEPLDGIVAAQSWHWTAEDRWDRAASLLRPGGLLALWWNVELWGSGELMREMASVYRAHSIDAQRTPLWNGNGEAEDWPENEFAAHPGFEYGGMRSYPAIQSYRAADFADYLDTTSHHRILEDERRASVSAEIRAMIDARGGELTVNRHTRLYTGRRR